MAGRGSAAQAPCCPAGAGFEYRAVTAPDRLVSLAEPFGAAENRPDGINDETRKSGSLVSAFVCEYFRLTGRAVVGVSASQGGTSSAQWAAALAEDAARRLRSARAYLSAQGQSPENVFLLWSQGETDGDHAVTAEAYRSNFTKIWQTLRDAGCTRCGLIQTGHFNRLRYPEGMDGVPGEQLDRQYGVICAEQARIVQDMADVFAAGSFLPYLEQMKDAFHYRQAVYNAVGTEAAHLAAAAFRTG